MKQGEKVNQRGTSLVPAGGKKGSDVVSVKK